MRSTRSVRSGGTTRALLMAVSLALLPGRAAGGPDEKSTPPPEKRFTAAAEATLVEVPVHVMDRNGAPMRGLKKEDFELYDDGARVEIRELEVVDLEDFRGTAPGGPVATPRDMPLPPAARRHFFLLFDLSFSAPVKTARARTAARDFVLNGMKNGDFAAVATYDVEKGMKLVLSFTPDRDQLVHAVETLGLPNLVQPMSDPLALMIVPPNPTAPSSQAVGDVEMAEILDAVAAASRKSFESYQRGRVTAMMKSFQDLAQTLNSVRGRKHVIYFSEGFDSRLLVGETTENAGRTEGDRAVRGEIWRIESEHRFGDSTLKSRLHDVLALFNRSDCVVHAVDISGLTERRSDPQSGFPGDQSGSAREGGLGRGQESLFLLAHETGGEVLKNSNDLPNQLEKLQQQTALVYLVVFSPTNLKEPGRFHTLKVKVKAPGARVSARAGYYEPRPFSKLSPMERRLATAELIAFGLPRTEVAARVLAAPFKVAGEERATVSVIVEISGARLLVDQVGPKLSLEIYAYATDEKLRVRDFFTQQVGFELEKLRGALETRGVKYYGTLSLAPGSYWLKVLVRNVETGRMGLQIVPLTVPEYQRRELFVLPPLFQEAPGRWVMVKAPPRPNRPDPGGYPFVFEGQSFVPAAGPAVDKGETASLYLVAYGPASKGPLEVEGRVVGTDGKDRGAGKLTLVKASPPEAEGLRRLLCSFETASLESGAYSLLVTVHDRTSGQEGQSSIPFEVR